MSGTPVNRVLSGPTETVPAVGMGVTVTHWSDRSPATVVAVRLFGSGQRKGKPREIDIQFDNWEAISGNEGDGSASYAYSRNEDSPISTYLVNQHGRWVQKGVGSRGNGLVLGVRQRYYDPHL